MCHSLFLNFSSFEEEFFMSISSVLIILNVKLYIYTCIKIKSFIHSSIPGLKFFDGKPYQTNFFLLVLVMFDILWIYIGFL